MVAATSEDLKQIFLALGQHFALQGQLDLFATQILELLRGDSRPQLIYRVDTLLDLLARVPGACGALARLYRAPARLPIKNARSAKICASSSKRHGRPLRGGGGVKAPRFVDVESAWRTLARRASQDVRWPRRLMRSSAHLPRVVIC